MLDVCIARSSAPLIGQHRAETIKRHHVADVVEKVASRGSFVTADHVLGLIRAIYNWANGTGSLEINPTLGLKKRNFAKPRERVLSDAEVRSLWQALDAAPKLSHEIRTALKLELLLGIRIGEALGAERNEIDLEQRIWTIPAQRTKAKREHRLPLPSLAVELLRMALERAGESPWLFPLRKSSRQVERANPRQIGNARGPSATRPPGRFWRLAGISNLVRSTGAPGATR